MADLIQIKRSETVNNFANIVFGELAFTTNGDILYIGDSTNAVSIPIAGRRTPGTLSANQAIVVNSSSYVDILKTANLVANAIHVDAIVLTSNGSITNVETIVVTTSNTVDLNVSGNGTINSLFVTGNIVADGDISNVDTIYAKDIQVGNTLSVNGDIILRGDNITIGDGGDVISIGATVNSHIIPDSNTTYDLGSSTSIWRKLFTKEINEGVDSPLNHKVDVLWKKIGFNKTRTDFITNKTALDETQISNMIIAPSEIWTDANSIASTKPASNTSVAIVYNELELTEDTSSTSLRTWKTNIINWIPPRFGPTYQITVYSDTAGSTNPASNGTQLFETGSGNNDEWYFDYQSGVLHFIGSSLPSSVTAGKSVFISGAKYNGNTGFTGTALTGANLVNATITSLSTPLEVKDGGTGVSSFTANSILGAANSSTLSFKTGSNGQVMIVTDNDVEFSDLDGGTY